MKAKKLTALFLSIVMIVISVCSGTIASAADEYTTDHVLLNVGADASQRSVVWYSDAEEAGTVQLALKSDMDGDVFPQEYMEFQATTTESVEGYTVNRAVITGLEPNTEYVYRVGVENGRSDVFSFNTQNFDGEYSFLLAGDPQIGSSNNESDAEGWRNTLSKAYEAFPDVSFIISAGDQVNINGDEAQYDGFLSSDVLHSLPLAVNMGNHESGDVSYTQHFYMPNMSQYGEINDLDGTGDYWYVYDNTLFMSLNSNNRTVAEHRAFMEEAIAANPDVTWKVVTFHHSIYSTASHAFDGDILERRSEYSPVFSELGIDVVFMGHDHVYTRTYLMNGTTPVIPDDGNISSVTDPEDGEVLYVTANSASGSKFYSIRDNEFDFAAVENQERTPNISKIDVTDNSFTITTYRVSDMSVVDTFEITRSGAADNDTELTAPENANVNAVFTIEATVPTSSNVSSFNLQNESGRKISVKAVSSADNGDGTTTWNISTSIGTAGDRTITVIPVSEDGSQLDAVTFDISITAPETSYDILSAEFASETVNANTPVDININSGSLVKSINITNHNGLKMGKQLVSSSINDDGTRSWVYSMSMATGGGERRAFNVMAKNADGVYENGVQAYIAVI